MVPRDQPFFLHAMAQSLRIMEDPDVDIIDNNSSSNFVSGVHLGHLQPLGPTPQVYRERIKEAMNVTGTFVWATISRVMKRKPKDPGRALHNGRAGEQDDTPVREGGESKISG